MCKQKDRRRGSEEFKIAPHLAVACIGIFAIYAEHFVETGSYCPALWLQIIRVLKLRREVTVW
jgi:hypothetical protein